MGTKKKHIAVLLDSNGKIKPITNRLREIISEDFITHHSGANKSSS